MTEQEIQRIQPTDSAIAEPYWEGCRQGELRMQHCPECDQYQFYPRTLCSHCGASGTQWRAVTGRATVTSFTVVRRGISPAYPAPYVVALVTLEEGPTMMTQVLVDDPDSVRIGQPVTVRFESWGMEHVMPVFVAPGQVV